MEWWDSFRDQVVIVTGASSGIGRETALGFGAAGARVALMARRREALEATQSAITKAGGRAIVLPADVTKPTAVRTALHAVRRQLGRIDIVVNNAGVLIPSPVTTLKPADLTAMLRVNLFGALHVMQQGVSIMRKQPDGGSIINVASLAGRRGFSPLGGYCATKFALVGLTEALRMELLDTKVHVGLILPGIVETPMAEERTLRDLWPQTLNMPPEWVVWAIFAAARFRLVELSVPPGAATLEKLAALAPGIADSVAHWSSRASRWLAELLAKDPPSR